MRLPDLADNGSKCLQSNLSTGICLKGTDCLLFDLSDTTYA